MDRMALKNVLKDYIRNKIGFSEKDASMHADNIVTSLEHGDPSTLEEVKKWNIPFDMKKALVSIGAVGLIGTSLVLGNQRQEDLYNQQSKVK